MTKNNRIKGGFGLHLLAGTRTANTFCIAENLQKSVEK